jgi:hypothetical protein
VQRALGAIYHIFGRKAGKAISGRLKQVNPAGTNLSNLSYGAFPCSGLCRSERAHEGSLSYVMGDA